MTKDPPHFWAAIFQLVYAVILTKNGLGYIVGDF
jgi:hypothetical protein